MKIYIGGSLANARIRELGLTIQHSLSLHTRVFNDWAAAHPEADDKWRDYEQEKKHTIQSALRGHAGQQVFNFDRLNLIAADIFVLVLPCGKSAHLEAGFMSGLREAGFGKKVYALIDQEPQRYDVMYNFFDAVFSTEDELLLHLNKDEQYYSTHGRVA